MFKGQQDRSKNLHSGHRNMCNSRTPSDFSLFTDGPIAGGMILLAPKQNTGQIVLSPLLYRHCSCFLLIFSARLLSSRFAIITETSDLNISIGGLGRILGSKESVLIYYIPLVSQSRTSSY